MISWLAVLQSVPWSDVITNAPKVADGAKKLWNTVAKKPTPIEHSSPDTALPVSAEAKAMAALQAQVTSLETAVSDLHSQMLASSELIKDLAEQNAQLIARIEANRKRTFWLTGAVAIATVVAVSCIILLAAQA